MQPAWLRAFDRPGNEFRGAPFWSWNSRLDPEELRRQIHELRRMGFGGFLSMGSRYFTSFCMRKPATLVFEKLATVAVEAWARWAVPKASFTYISP